MSSEAREWKDIHLAVFIFHLDLLSYDTHTKLHCLLSAWWSKRFFPNLFPDSAIVFDSFCQRWKIHLQRARNSILPKACHSAALWNPASTEHHLKISPGLAWPCLTGILGGTWPHSAMWSPGSGCSFPIARQSKVLCVIWWQLQSMNRETSSISSWIALSL